MGGIYEIGSRGEQLLAAYLKANGRTVAHSDRKTFDLIVDGRYAEVKTSESRYSKLGFIGLTDSQYRELKAGTPFSIFVVCNAREPDALEVLEFDAAELLKAEPKVECTYYWYRSHLDKCRATGSVDGSRSVIPWSAVASDHSPAVQTSPAEHGPVVVYVRRLSKAEDPELYLRVAPSDVARLELLDHQPLSVVLDKRLTIRGILRVSGGNSWLAPAPGSSNAAITRELRAAGFDHGQDVTAKLRSP